MSPAVTQKRAVGGKVGSGGSQRTSANNSPPTVRQKPVKAPSAKWPEWRLQAEMVAEFHKLESEGWQLTVAGDMNSAKRSRAAAMQAKVMGLTPGETDLRLYCANGQLISIEVKTMEGKLSEPQRARHARLQALGFTVYTLWLRDPEHARGMAFGVANVHSHKITPGNVS